MITNITILDLDIVIIAYLYRPKDAARAIRKRLAGNKNFKSVILTLTVGDDVLTEMYKRFQENLLARALKFVVLALNSSKPWSFSSSFHSSDGTLIFHT